MTISDDWIDKACEADPLPADDLDEEAVTLDGPPLTPEEINAARIRLAAWQSPKAFCDYVLALCRRSPSHEYFRRPQLKFLQDAFVLAEFAAKHCVDQVRLADRNEEWPDGFVNFKNRTFNIEVTSTHGGRKLGDEYRKVDGARPVVEHDPVENWVARAESIPKFLDEAISAKANRKYASRCWLVVYLNIGEWGIRHAEIEQVIAETISRYLHEFENISVLWKGKLYSADECREAP